MHHTRRVEGAPLGNFRVFVRFSFLFFSLPEVDTSILPGAESADVEDVACPFLGLAYCASSCLDAPRMQWPLQVGARMVRATHTTTQA